ncbi:replication-associated recombination protein A [Turneriella parva]|uniref:Replication-associated recombination protein A n=1 Tax=Turneriella parva (strain ATCC BAA-1111 / DSM 21527 / NCTC 11395 / H) TaxID=869212 RepID=I4B2X5_TURPD|nr:replication-associated recombination protein A [Turneriella parva]AFM11632.1 AAA ATPase central domain protein [Turneriella parva DSM 21527]
MKPGAPLAERMRPKSLAEYVGQKHLVGEGAVLRRAVESKTLPSIILWGPPGVGKTTLANILAVELKRPFYSLSAINSGVKDIREVIEKASGGGLFTEKPVLFIDEIHRFSKSQQDSLLGAVETGKITLIGATTENPSFEVISALLSRCQVYILKNLDEADLLRLLHTAMEKDSFLKTKRIQLAETAALFRLSGGDARRLLNVFELVIDNLIGDPQVTDKVVLEIVQQNPVLYDKAGDNHYDIISAFIKSIRGSDPNGAVYWLARMVEGGEDALFIARRMLIAASEDIGNANPTAMVVALNCFQAVNAIGYPEARIVLAQAATYLATSPKSNAAYAAINKAQEVVRETGNLPVPLHLRNAPTSLMKDIGYGQGYEYAHDKAGNFSPQEYLPEALSGKKLYDPGNNAREREIREALKKIWGDKYGY